MYSSLSSNPLFDMPKNENEKQDAPLIGSFHGALLLLPAAIFAQMMNSGIPVIAEAAQDKKTVNSVVWMAMSITCAFYIMICLPTTIYFGSDVDDSCNLNWANFNGGYNDRASDAELPWWVNGIRYFIVLFPSLDVLSVYPLNNIMLSNNLMATIYSDRMDSAQSDHFIVRFVRFCTAFPPIVCGLVFPNLSSVVNYTGCIGIAVAFLIPPYLTYIAAYKTKVALGIRLDANFKTQFSSFFTTKEGCYCCMGLGIILLVVVIGSYFYPQ